MYIKVLDRLFPGPAKVEGFTWLYLYLFGFAMIALIGCLLQDFYLADWTALPRRPTEKREKGLVKMTGKKATAYLARSPLLSSNDRDAQASYGSAAYQSSSSGAGATGTSPKLAGTVGNAPPRPVVYSNPNSPKRKALNM